MCTMQDSPQAVATAPALMQTGVVDELVAGRRHAWACAAAAVHAAARQSKNVKLAQGPDDGHVGCQLLRSRVQCQQSAGALRPSVLQLATYMPVHRPLQLHEACLLAAVHARALSAAVLYASWATGSAHSVRRLNAARELTACLSSADASDALAGGVAPACGLPDAAPSGAGADRLPSCSDSVLSRPPVPPAAGTAASVLPLPARTEDLHQERLEKHDLGPSWALHLIPSARVLPPCDLLLPALARRRNLLAYFCTGLGAETRDEMEHDHTGCPTSTFRV